MSILAIDTSTREAGVVALTDTAGRVLGSERLDGGRLEVTLPQAVARLLDGTLEAVVVLTGPGSYTGVRAGMAAALGLAVGRAVPLHGAGTLEAVAAVAGAPAGAFVAASAAGRGGAYAAEFVRAGGSSVLRSGPRRVDAGTLASLGLPVLATTPIEDVVVVAVDRTVALAAAVPLALARAALQAAGLSAVTVRPAVGDGAG